MNRERVEKTYAFWAPVYDIVFRQVFDQPRRAAVASAERIGGSVLEVGVGTGLSLPLYSPKSRVTGIDISIPMLAKAKKRVHALGLKNIAELRVMDAQRLDFPDACFDVLMAQYVVNTVPDPDAALDEFTRVLKPGGELIVVNRVGADAGARLVVERLLQPLSARLGWRSEFPWGRFQDWLRRSPSMVLLENRPMPPFNHFALLRFGKHAQSAVPG